MFKKQQLLLNSVQGLLIFFVIALLRKDAIDEH